MKSITKKITAALAVALLAVGVVALVPEANVLAGGDCSVTGGVAAGTNCATPDSEQRSLVGSGGLFETVVNILLFIVGAVAVIMLIIGGIRYVVSGGDQSQVTAAKNTILYAIIGIIVALLAYALVNFVTTQIVDNTTTTGVVTSLR